MVWTSRFLFGEWNATRGYFQVSVMAYTGRLHPKGGSFLGFRSVWKKRDFTSWSIWKGSGTSSCQFRSGTHNPHQATSMSSCLTAFSWTRLFLERFWRESKGPKVLSMLRDVFYGCEKFWNTFSLVFLFIHILKTVNLQQLFSLCSVFSVLFRGICYIIPHGLIHCLKSGGGFDCNRGGVWDWNN